jgi:hypothetical protein
MSNLDRLYFYAREIASMNRTEIEELYADIQAYRSLEGLEFDFGDGMILNELLQGTEEAYWEMDLQDLEDLLSYYENRPPPLPKKVRLNRYECKKITQKKLKKLHDLHCYFVRIDSFNELGFYRRVYLSGRRGYAKWCSRRAVRNREDFTTYKSNSYRKVFDYGWTLY